MSSKGKPDFSAIDPLINHLINEKYHIQELIGQGGMARVYRGIHVPDDTLVAIKVMHQYLVTQKDFVRRFQREAQALSGLRHPNIVRIYDYDVGGTGMYYLVMEHLSGGTLKELLERLKQTRQLLPLDEVVNVVIQIGEALAHAHKHHLFHRDIKSDNILLDGKGRAKLTDFGIVKMMSGQVTTHTMTGALIGTPAYMSPEQAMGKPGDSRSDIYSLGVLMYQLATGKLPFQGDTPLSVVLKHVNEAPIPPSQRNERVPQALQNVILKAMAKRPSNRYQTADDLLADLETIEMSLTYGDMDDLFDESHTPLDLDEVQQTAVVHPPTSNPVQQVAVPPTQEEDVFVYEPVAHEIPCPHCQTPLNLEEASDPYNCPNCRKEFALHEHLCPYCYHYNENETSFCNNCGESLSRLCPSCNTFNWAGYENCYNCQEPLDIFSALKARTDKSGVRRLEGEIERARQHKEEEKLASAKRLEDIRERERQLIRRARWRRAFSSFGRMILLILLLIASIFIVLFIVSNI